MAKAVSPRSDPEAAKPPPNGAPPPPGAAIKVLCVLPRQHDARISRRLDMLRAAGFAVEVVAFARDYDAGRAANLPVEVVGHLRNVRYLGRIGALLKAVPTVRRAIRRNQLVYAFNSDIGALAVLASRGTGAQVAVEIADIVPAQLAHGVGHAVRLLERVALRRAGLLVLTTGGYLPHYRRRLKVCTPAIVVENKLDAAYAAAIRPAAAPPPATAPRDRPLRIGWFGVLREPWSLKALDALTRQAPERFRAVLAGSFDNRLTELGIDAESFERVIGNPAIQYLGGYTSPEDLAGLYAQVDMVMDCYRTTPPHAWSQTNKYYEACLFAKPLIARAGTHDAEQIARRGLGLVVTAATPEGAASEVAAVTAEDWLAWRANLAALPRASYALVDEVAALREALTALRR